MRKLLLGLVLSLMTLPTLAQEDAAPTPAPAPAAKPKPKKAKKPKPIPVRAAEAPEEAAPAEASGPVTRIEIDGLTAKASAFYRLELRRDDHGLARTEDHEPTGTTTIGMPEFKLGLEGEVARNLAYQILIDTVNSDTLELGKVTWSVNPTFTVILGVDYVNQGGFENKLEGYDTIYLSPYVDALMPLPGSAPAVAVQAKVMGTVTLQLVEDVPTPGSNDPKMQPATTLEWLGEFGSLSPLLQMGVYGNGNSKFLAVGVSYDAKAYQASFDYVMDFHSTRYAAGTTVKRLDTVYNNVVVEGRYKGLAAAEPFAKLIAFAAAEPEDDDFGLEDIGYNSYDADGEPLLDDNATILSLGARMPLVHDDLVPYAALDLVTATYQDPADPTATEDRGQIIVQLGAAGAL